MIGKVVASTAAIAAAIGWSTVSPTVDAGRLFTARPRGGVSEVASVQKNASTLLPVPSLQSIELAGRTQDYTVEFLRRFFEADGSIVTVRERQEVDAGGSDEPEFRVTFLGVVGEPPGSALHVEWQNAYDKLGPLFYRYGSFRVHDLAQAANNYVLHDFGPVVRAGRSARRMVVFPNLSDKAICVIDVDQQTNVPLFLAEFDPQLQLLSEVEAVTFAPTVQPIVGNLASDSTPIATFAQAQALLGDPPGLVEPDPVAAAEYVLNRIDVRDDPLNGSQQLSLSYTDGIDQFTILEVPGTGDPFATLPARVGGAPVIGRFRDPAISALFFWDGGVLFKVFGKGAMKRLDEVAMQLYERALSTN